MFSGIGLMTSIEQSKIIEHYQNTYPDKEQLDKKLTRIADFRSIQLYIYLSVYPFSLVILLFILNKERDFTVFAIALAGILISYLTSFHYSFTTDLRKFRERIQTKTSVRNSIRKAQEKIKISHNGTEFGFVLVQVVLIEYVLYLVNPKGESVLNFGNLKEGKGAGKDSFVGEFLNKFQLSSKRSSLEKMLIYNDNIKKFSFQNHTILKERGNDKLDEIYEYLSAIDNGKAKMKLDNILKR